MGAAVAWINLDDDAPRLRDWMEPFASIYDALEGRIATRGVGGNPAGCR